VRYLGLIALATLLVVAACDGGAAEPESPTPAAPADAETISIFDFGYDPATLTISLGQSVTWTNDGDAPHTVTFEDGTDSGTLDAGGSYERGFDSVGEFSYACSLHPAMRGVVNVGP
jgi:plastocyanin